MKSLHTFVVGAVLATAAHAQIDVGDIVDQILGEGTQPVQELDVTEDGVVDARDVACFIGGCNPPTVEFALATTDAAEGAGTVQLELTLSRSAFCTLNYSVDGSATAGVDYGTPAGAITLAGSTASIPITLLDDAALDEELEMVIVSLDTGSCYQPGASSVHSLHIFDNDRTWFGTLDSGGELLGFQLEVVETGGGRTATLVSDGTGTLPPGSWAVPTFTQTDTAFSMVVDPVSVGASTTAFATGFTRTFSFSATDGTPNHTVEPGLLRGSYSEVLNAASSPHLSTTITGTFTLIEGLPVPSTWQPPLDPSP